MITTFDKNIATSEVIFLPSPSQDAAALPGEVQDHYHHSQRRLDCHDDQERYHSRHDNRQDDHIVAGVKRPINRLWNQIEINQEE